MNTINALNINDLTHYLKPRSKESHKGDFGRVLIIGGNVGYSGAVQLAGEAALRVGAGVVTIATHPEHAPYLNISCPELMCHGIPNQEVLNKLLEQATVIAIGPGLGTDEWSLSLLKTTLARTDKPLLLDADALNLIALNKIQMKRAPCIYTPHPGEAARLLAITPQEIQQNRFDALKKLYALLGGIMTLDRDPGKKGS